MSDYTVMEYIYRDVNNFKAFGMILLSGDITEGFLSEIKIYLDYGEYFVAEQVNIPVLYEHLWKFSSGPTMADHAFHEFSDFRAATDDEIKSLPLWGTTEKLLQAFRSVGGQWNCSQSVHGDLF